MYDISLIHNCQLSVSELCEKLNKLSLENKQEKENNQQLIQRNKDLVFQNNMLQIDLSNVPFSKDGVLIWIIDNLSERIDEAYRCQKSSISSPKFLSLTDEHLLNARLFLYGDESAHPNYISLHIQLSPGGKNMLVIPVTCCLVDHTTHRHIMERDDVCLSQQNIGTICRFSQFIETNLVHAEGSRFVDKDTLCLIIKVHQEQSNQYNDLPVSIQHALRHIN